MNRMAIPFVYRPWLRVGIPFVIVEMSHIPSLFLFHPNQLAHVVAAADGFGKDGFAHAVGLKQLVLGLPEKVYTWRSEALVLFER